MIRKLLLLLLLTPAFAFAQAPTSDSTKLTAPPVVNSAVPSSWYARGGNYSNMQVGFQNTLLNKWVQVVTGYQFNHYTGTSTQAQINTKQTALNGIGYVKANGASISYDNSTFLKTLPEKKFNTNAVSFNYATPYHSSEGVIVKIPNSNTVFQMFRYDNYQNHVSDSAKLVFRHSYNLGKTWTPIQVLADSAGVDDRNAAGGIAANKIVIFYRRYKKATGQQIDYGYKFSSDTGHTWSAYQVLGTGTATVVPFGRIFKVGGKWAQSFYTAGTNNTGFYLTSTDGVTWGSSTTIFNVTAATKNYSELCVANVSTNPAIDSLIALVRNDGIGSTRVDPFVQFTSIGGTIWTEVGSTNLGGTAALGKNNVTPSIGYDTLQKKVFVLAVQRVNGGPAQWQAYNTNKIELYVNKNADIWSSPTSWTATSEIPRPWPAQETIYGHPLFTKVNDYRYLVVFTDRQQRNTTVRSDDNEIANLFQLNMTIDSTRNTSDTTATGYYRVNNLTGRIESKTLNAETPFGYNDQLGYTFNSRRTETQLTAKDITGPVFSLLDSAGNYTHRFYADGSLYTKHQTTSTTIGNYELKTRNTSTGKEESLAVPGNIMFTTNAKFVSVDGNNLNYIVNLAAPDLNLLSGTQFAYCASPTNGPGGNGWIEVSQRDANVIKQEFTTTTNLKYFRTTVAGTSSWGAWKKILNDGAPVTVAQGGTGVASLTGIVKGNGTGAFTAAVSNTDYLPVSNPAMTGIPTAPTATAGTNNTQIATTAFVHGYVPTTRTITINGVTNDLSADATFNVSTLDQIFNTSVDYTITGPSFGNSKVLDIYVDASSNNVTITMPSAATFAGYTVYVTKEDASANTVTVNTVLGGSTLTSQYQSRSFKSNTTSWYNH